MRQEAVPWRTVALTLLLVPSVILSAVLVAVMLTDPSVPFDWWLWEQAADRAGAADLFAWGAPSPYPDEPYGFRYSPLFAWLMVPFADAGLWVWRALHLAVLFLLPWRLALLTLAFAPFWYDVLHGNVMTFVMVAGYLALSKPWGAWVWFAWVVLVPRPLMLPLSVWLVWKRPESRVPAVVMASVGLATLLYPGFADALLASSRADSIDNLAPSALIGWAWVPVGLALGAWLTWRGRLGLAGLAVSPYVLPYYLLALGWELTSAPASRAGSKTTTP